MAAAADVADAVVAVTWLGRREAMNVPVMAFLDRPRRRWESGYGCVSVRKRCLGVRDPAYQSRMKRWERGACWWYQEHWRVA